LTAFEYRAEDALLFRNSAFSETALTLSDIKEVNEVFDREYYRVEYDKKTSGLINKLQRRFRASDKEALRTWRNLGPATRGFA
jgi:hypothetical protein